MQSYKRPQLRNDVAQLFHQRSATWGDLKKSGENSRFSVWTWPRTIVCGLQLKSVGHSGHRVYKGDSTHLLTDLKHVHVAHVVLKLSRRSRRHVSQGDLMKVYTRMKRHFMLFEITTSLYSKKILRPTALKIAIVLALLHKPPMSFLLSKPDSRLWILRWPI